MKVGVDCSLPDASTEKVLDEEVTTKEGHVRAKLVLALQGLKPPTTGFSFKACFRAEPPGSQPQLPQPQVCPDTGACRAPW